MKQRDLAKALITIGWLSGLAVLIAALPLPIAVSAPVAAVAAAVALARWGGKVRITCRLAIDVVRMRVKARRLTRDKTGGSLERA